MFKFSLFIFTIVTTISISFASTSGLEVEDTYICRPNEKPKVTNLENFTEVLDLLEQLNPVTTENLSDDRIFFKNYYRKLEKIARESWKTTKSLETCRSRLIEEYQSGPYLWSDLSKRKRMERIHKHSLRTFKLLKDQKVKRINRYLKPHMMTCIAFIETKTTLSPHTLNYSFCQRRNNSSAQGLGGVTRRTFKDLRERKRLPLTSVKGYENATDDEIFEAMNGDVPLQMEVGFRILSEKFNRSVKNGGTEFDIIARGASYYDTDNKSKYVKKFKKCHQCFERAGLKDRPIQCFNEMNR